MFFYEQEIHAGNQAAAIHRRGSNYPFRPDVVKWLHWPDLNGSYFT